MSGRLFHFRRYRKMTEQEKMQIKKMRDAGCSYGVISSELGISRSTISTFLKTLDSPPNCCLECGKKLVHIEGHRRKKYCSDKRRHSYNKKFGNNNVNMSYETECAYCHKKFKTYKSLKKKYCSWDCYLKGRYGGVSHERQ